MRAQLIIGLEVHVQLQTRTKLFCGCVNRFNPDAPNTQTCPVCLGLPGALPVLNRTAVELAMQAGLALNCEITPHTKWDRKQYYYPDLPKAYQISQFDLPICQHGFVGVPADDATADNPVRRVRILRAHLEEDAGKNMHDESARGGDSRVDLNRCGTPLLEIVTEPDLRSAVEARDLLDQLKLTLSYIGVSDCNMQEGSLRCDANVNLHIEQADGTTVATPIVEVKNLNSFRGVEAAILFEERRQREEFEKTGQKLGDPGAYKETRGWDVNLNATVVQRGKEEAADYRYFPDPDLVTYEVPAATLSAIRNALIELPTERKSRFLGEYGLTEYDANVIIDQGPAFAAYFEDVARTCGDGKQAANWVTQDVQRELNDRKLEISEFSVSSAVLGALLRQIVEKTITVKSGRELFQAFLAHADDGSDVTVDLVERWIDERGLRTVTDTGAFTEVIDRVLAANERIAGDIRGGKLQAAGPLIGQVMRECKGADPKVIRDLIIARAEQG